jgi:glycosyltransferase involved in cell wall biosynthesis
MGRHAVYIVALGRDVASDILERGAQPPTVALLPWGDVFEDFLDRLGVSFDELRLEFVGSWIFGYAAALATAGVRSVIVCPTARFDGPVTATHEPTGAELRFLPTSRLHRSLRAHRLDGRLDGRRDPRSLGRALATHVAPYFGTPAHALLRLLREQRCAALVCQEYEDPRFDVCVGVGRRAEVSVFGTFQGADYQLSRLERPVRPRSIRASAGLIVGAQRELERVRDAYGVPAPKLAHVGNPVDAVLWRPVDGGAIRRELDISVSALVVAWHGQLQLRRKGLDVLLDAWRVLAETRGAHLVLVGAGEDAGEIARRAQTQRNVHLVNEWVQDRERMRAILSSADVYVFPSRHEGLPVAPLEAMACGLPVVGADATGVADVVGETGIVVPRDDPDGLARALGGLLDDTERRIQLGRAARIRVEQTFALEAVGAALRSFLVDRDVV